MRSFFKIKTADEIFTSLQDIMPLGLESVPITAAFNRVLAEDITAHEDLPGFKRSTMDGYALAAKDSFGASENLPTPLTVVGEVKMGEIPRCSLHRGECVQISTGGMLPEGADAVIMVEYTQMLDEGVVEISKPVSPLENVILPDDDLKKGQVVLHKGSLLRPQDLGICAGLGIGHIMVYTRPKAAIISTGEEIVDISKKPEAGQMRDINSYTLGGLCVALGVDPIYMGIIKDKFEDIRLSIERAISQADVVLLSGGSSVGVKDFTLDAFLSLDGVKLVAHGVSISPGKPTIIARKKHRTLWGLPGHPVSAMIIFDVFLSYLFRKLSGISDLAAYHRQSIEAELDRNIESATGRDDYIRVKLIQKEGGWSATPILGKSGLISTMVEADGLVTIDRNTEGLYKGEKVKVRLF
jgi:molybdopterin molybdotransferase